MSVLKELCVEHSYYCSESNYYSNDANYTWETMTEFLDEFEDADIDYNMCFHWDIHQKLDEYTEELVEGEYRAEVFLMLQRKGIFQPHAIENIDEEEAVRFKEYAQRHWNYLTSLWKPISTGE